MMPKMPGIVGSVQQRQEGARHPHHAMEVNLHQPLEIILADLFEGPAQRHARIVHQQIDPLVRGFHFVREGAHRAAVGDVEAVRGDAHAKRLCRMRGLDRAGLVDIGQRQVAAAAGHGEGGGAADAAACAGDDGDPVGEVQGKAPLVSAFAAAKCMTPSAIRP
jgi:hypothetical protein